MAGAPKILLVDDDAAFLELYQEMLSKHLSSMPEVRTTSSAPRALSLLESEPYNLLIVDLNMPKIDGLQILSISRRKYPHLRLVVLTGVRDEQFRTRAYAMGVDQYWIKPESDQEIGLFMEAMEALLKSETLGGFRGVQSKSLVDIIQLECMSQSSCVLKISNGLIDGKIWIQNGEVIDAEAADIAGEPAFQRILSWKTGSFEILQADPERQRTINSSYQGLLLNTAQALDEAASQVPLERGEAEAGKATFALTEICQWPHVDCVLSLRGKNARDYYGLEDAAPVAKWVEETMNNFQELGERLQVGQLQQIIGTGPRRKMAMTTVGTAKLCIGFSPAVTPEQLRETFKNILTKWAS
jgi:CheY-like chemotaxis protein